MGCKVSNYAEQGEQQWCTEQWNVMGALVDNKELVEPWNVMGVLVDNKNWWNNGM